MDFVKILSENIPAAVTPIAPHRPSPTADQRCDDLGAKFSHLSRLCCLDRPHQLWGSARAAARARAASRAALAPRARRGAPRSRSDGVRRGTFVRGTGGGTGAPTRRVRPATEGRSSAGPPRVLRASLRLPKGSRSFAGPRRQTQIGRGGDADSGRDGRVPQVETAERRRSAMGAAEAEVIAAASADATFVYKFIPVR